MAATAEPGGRDARRSRRSAIGFRAGNMALRGLALVAKFALLVLLVRYLPPADVGLYGLIAATVMYVQYALGFDYCKYANREYITAEPDRRPSMLRDQAVFYTFTYALIAPTLLFLFTAGLLPWSVVVWFFVLLTLEHIAHETGRVLIAMSEQLTATITLFLRAGAWVVVLGPALWLNPEFRSLDWVLGAWAAGAGLACIVSLGVILRAHRQAAVRSVDWSWIRRGALVAAPFLVSTLALKAMGTLDRYLVASFADAEVLAAYVLFAGIAAAVKAFLDSGVFAFAYPALVDAASRGDGPAFRRGMGSLAWQTALIAGMVTVVAVSMMDPLLAWIGHRAYQGQLPLFYWTLAATNLQAAGLVAYYGNYANRRDLVIVTSQISGLAAFVMAAYALRSQGAVAVPKALCIGQGVALMLNWLSYFQIPLARSRSLDAGDRDAPQ